MAIKSIPFSNLFTPFQETLKVPLKRSTCLKLALLALLIFFIKSTTSSQKKILASLSHPANSAQKLVELAIKNRGGLAWLLGMVIVPSQFLHSKKSNDELIAICKKFNTTLNPFHLPSGVQGAIYYPANWDPNNRTQCVLYHNSNKIILEKFFNHHQSAKQPLRKAPEQIGEILKCPIIFYNYRGTGKSRQTIPTHATILEDGEEVLQHALKHFDSVTIIGSSLGGAVATLTLDRHLNKSPEDSTRIKALINHDSFSASERVHFPFTGKLGQIVRSISDSVGGHIDAEKAMISLSERTTIPLTILTQKKDPIIPKSARLSAPPLDKSRIHFFESPSNDHATIDHHTKTFLTQTIKNE